MIDRESAAFDLLAAAGQKLMAEADRDIKRILLCLSRLLETSNAAVHYDADQDEIEAWKEAESNAKAILTEFSHFLTNENME